MSRPHTVRISSQQHTPVSSGTQTVATNTTGAVSNAEPGSPVNYDALKRAWAQFMADHKEQRILVSSMRVSEPAPTDDPSVFRVTVDNPGQRQAFEDSALLYDYLRRATGNPSLRLDVVVDTTVQRPIAMTQREFLDSLMERNPNIKSVLGSIEAELIN